LRLFSDAASSVADPFLRRAFSLAENGRGTTSPNPLVGCVIVRDGEVVGEGWHARAGEPHAEVNALAAAGERARGATAYVTLEPCNHTGRTGPCTRALIGAGVAGVVIGIPDPNPGVEGGGAETLRSRGVQVRFADDPAPFLEQNEAWLKCVRTGIPWVQAKVALTIDGRAALEGGSRSAITGAGGAEVTRRLRAAADAVVVGAATAEIDDPALTVRDPDGSLALRQPLRVVLARGESPSSRLQLFSPAGAAPPAVVVMPEDPVAAPHSGDGAAGDTAGGIGVTPPPTPPVTPPSGRRVAAASPGVLRYPGNEGLTGALRALAGATGCTRVLVEPGPRLFAALWSADAIDELVVVTAGGIGGREAVPLFAEEWMHRDKTRLDARMRAVEAGVAGEDAVTVWRRRNERE
jgi:diaminohydroxyphosphoribosylaminopyrimidine deaminase/5-amino-6-(5-phosphoribosylamino)uracil reductase